MPTHTGKDSKGCFAQWGSQAKYYYKCNDEAAKKRAVAKADAQGRAIRVRGYAGNDSRVRPDFVTTVVNLSKELVRNDQMEGKDWTVVPTQLITEGVHEGSGGPIYYPAEELEDLVVSCNHMPVVVYHPKSNGQFVTARDPITLTTHKVGMLMNTAWNDETKKLGGESWLDPSRMDAVDARVGQAIENNEMMEVSTGVYMRLEPVEGEWNGEPYVGIARDLLLDHLALLPDQKGACSIDDGAGFLRANASITPEQLRKLMVNEMSHDSVRRFLASWLREHDDNAWIEDVYDDFFVYENAGKLFKQEYANEQDVIKPTGIPVQVVRVTEYRTLTGDFVGNETKGELMKKKDVVNKLIQSDRTEFTEEDRETLEGLNEGILNKMAANAEPQPEPQPKPTANAEPQPEPTANVAPKPTANAAPESKPRKIPTLEEFIANDCPPELREPLMESVQTTNAEKMRLVNVIRANERNAFTEEFLKTKSVSELKALAALAAPAETGAHPIPMFEGNGETPNDPVVNEEPLAVPVWEN